MKKLLSVMTYFASMYFVEQEAVFQIVCKLISKPLNVCWGSAYLCAEVFHHIHCQGK